MVKCSRTQPLTSAKLLSLSVPWFSHLSDRDYNCTYFPGCYRAEVKFYMSSAEKHAWHRVSAVLSAGSRCFQCRILAWLPKSTHPLPCVKAGWQVDGSSGHILVSARHIRLVTQVLSGPQGWQLGAAALCHLPLERFPVPAPGQVPHSPLWCLSANRVSGQEALSSPLTAAPVSDCYLWEVGG